VIHQKLQARKPYLIESALLTLSCFGNVTASSSNDIRDNGTVEEKGDVKNEKPVETLMARRIYVLFTFLQTMTATFASFVHGGNDVRYATL